MSHVSRYATELNRLWDESDYPNNGLRLLISSGNSYSQFTVLDERNIELARARVQQLPGCASVAVSSRGWVLPERRCQGLGKVLHVMNHAALRAAGFRAEIVTVRRDNSIMMHLMGKNPQSKIIDSQPSDHGGHVCIWRTNLV